MGEGIIPIRNEDLLTDLPSICAKIIAIRDSFEIKEATIFPCELLKGRQYPNSHYIYLNHSISIDEINADYIATFKSRGFEATCIIPNSKLLIELPSICTLHLAKGVREAAIMPAALILQTFNRQWIPRDPSHVFYAKGMPPLEEGEIRCVLLDYIDKSSGNARIYQL